MVARVAFRNNFCSDMPLLVSVKPIGPAYSFRELGVRDNVYATTPVRSDR